MSSESVWKDSDAKVLEQLQQELNKNNSTESQVPVATLNTGVEPDGVFKKDAQVLVDYIEKAKECYSVVLSPECKVYKFRS